MTLWAVYAAAGLSAIWFGIHTFVGGRQVALVIRQDTNLDPMVRTVAWMVWHMVTVTLLFMAGIFAAAGVLASRDFLAAGTILAALIAAAGIFAPAYLRHPFSSVPQGFLFVPIVALGIFALI